MCGIAGTVNFHLPALPILHGLRHRGPDETAFFQHKNVQFFITRLSIQDGKNGSQPRHLDDRLTLVFNGEIYNHAVLRHEYRLPCSSACDTDSLLFLYDKMGEKCLGLLDGMFAFAVLDKKNNRLFLARDRAGEKPLYFFHDGVRFAFASELNSLCCMLPLEIEVQNFVSYLRLGFFFHRNTPYRQVWELPAGSCGWLDLQTLAWKEKKWWNAGDYFRQPAIDDFEAALEKTEQLLLESVNLRLENSDHEVGAFLSGGIDSSLIAAMTARLGKPLHTFSLRLPGKYDETPLAKTTAQFLGTKHHEISLDLQRLPQEIEGILANYGEPFSDSSAIPCWYLSKAAKAHVKVVLSGDGADELFGGYRRYVPFAHIDFFKKNALRQGISKWLDNWLPLSHERKSGYNFLRRLVSLTRRDGLETWLAAASDIFEGLEQEIFVPDGMNALQEAFENVANTSTSDSYRSKLPALKKAMWFDFETLLAGDFLPKMDIASMAHSLEVRNPFLSKGLLEYASTLPAGFLVNGKTTKRLLRKLAEKHLSGNLHRQPKRGFEAPMKYLLAHELREIVHDTLRSPQVFFPNLVSPVFVQKLLNKQVVASAEKQAKMIWTLFSLEVWHRKYLHMQREPLTSRLHQFFP